MLLLMVAVSTFASAQHETSKILTAEWQFSIENTGGRGQTFRTVTDVFVDRKSGEIYIVDAGNRCVLVYNPSGSFVQKIAITGPLGVPKDVAVDSHGNIYVSHMTSPKISIYSYRGEHLQDVEIPGALDIPGFKVETLHLNVGPDGNVYALKSVGGLVKVDPFGERHQEISISGQDQPNAIINFSVDSKGRFLFADMRPYSVVMFDREKRKFRRFGESGVLYGQLVRPSSIAVDGRGNIWVLSFGRNRILCYDSEGKFIEEFGGSGREYGRFAMPVAMASDGGDRLFVAEEGLNRVQVFQIRWFKDRGGDPSGGDGKVPLTARKDEPASFEQ